MGSGPDYCGPWQGELAELAEVDSLMKNSAAKRRVEAEKGRMEILMEARGIE